MAQAELRQAGVLDLVDDRRDPARAATRRRHRARRRAARRPTGICGFGQQLHRFAGRPRERGSARSVHAGRARAEASAPRRAPSAPVSPAPRRARPPARSGSSGSGSTRSSGSIPGGNVKDGWGRQLAPGKLRFRSTPAPFWRVPLNRPSGFATWTTAQRVSWPGTRSSSRRASRPVCPPRHAGPRRGGPRPGPPAAAPRAADRCASGVLVLAPAPEDVRGLAFHGVRHAFSVRSVYGVRRRRVAAPSASASTTQPATMPTISRCRRSRRSRSPARARRRRR